MPLGPQPDPISDLISKLILSEIKTTIETYQWYAGLAILVQGIILTLILTFVARYFAPSKHIDGVAVRSGIVAMSVAALGVFIMNLVIFHKTVFDLPFDYINTSRIDTFCITAYLPISHCFTTPAAIFYSVRVWRLSGRKTWVIVPLSIMIAGTWAIVLYGVVQGFSLPRLTLANASQLKKYAEHMEIVVKVYAGYVFATDCAITMSSVFLLVRTKNEILPATAHRGLFARIIALMVEAMAPPTISNCLFVIYSAASGSVSTIRAFNRLTIASSPLFHFLSLMLSLVARQTVRKMLDADPISQLRNGSIPNSTGHADSWHSRKPSTSGFIEMPAMPSRGTSDDRVAVIPGMRNGQDWEKTTESSSEHLVKA